MTSFVKRMRTWLGIALFAGALPAAVSAELVDQIVANVNKVVITLSQVRQTEQQFLAQGRFKVNETIEQRQEQVLTFLIENELIRQRAAELGLLVNSDELDAALADIQQRNNFSEEQFKKEVQREGKTWDDFLEEIRQQIKIAKLMNREVYSRVQVQESDIDAYYQEHKAQFAGEAESVSVRQILFAIPENASQEDSQAIREKASQVAEEIRQGADFATLAQEYSEHASADKGGLLGTFKRGELVAPYDAAFTLESGEVSDPIRSDSGFHLIYVEDKTGGDAASFEQAKQAIRRKLFDELANQQYQTWVTGLREKAYIEVK